MKFYSYFICSIHRPPDSEGITLDILASDFWVPDASARAEAPQFQSKKIFLEILKTSAATCLLWAKRATQDW